MSHPWLGLSLGQVLPVLSCDKMRGGRGPGSRGLFWSSSGPGLREPTVTPRLAGPTSTC